MNERGDSPAERTDPKAPPRLSRRRFWRGLLGEMVIAAEEMRGIGHHTLQELRRLPDSVLAEVVPVWREDMNLEIREDGIYRQQSDATAVRVHLFAVYEKMMVDQYACGRNLRTIADQVAAATSVDPDSAFQATKDLFLRLCECQCCHPAVPPIP